MMTSELPSIRELEVFRATIFTGSATAAAERLGVSQPSISRTLAQIEERLNRRARELKWSNGSTPEHVGHPDTEAARVRWSNLKIRKHRPDVVGVQLREAQHQG